jgi:1-acyl-sn-glycerol-3-phosphate acyltransferase
MLEFSDAPYAFYPAKPNRLFLRLGRCVNRHISLGSKIHRIRRIEVEYAERLAPLRRDPKARILFLANHSTHSDAETISEVQRRAGIDSCFMAAYDVFQRSRIQGWAMQRLGAFSVDRDGNDSKSLKAAIDVLVRGQYALTIFPEGNVHFTNDRPTPFMEGASFIALKAQKDLGDAGTVQVVPVAMKFTHLTDQRATITRRVAEVAKTLGTEIDSGSSILEELKRIGIIAVERNLRQRGYPPPEPDQKMTNHLIQSAECILRGLEAKMELASKHAGSMIDRVRRIRAGIHQVRVKQERAIDHKVAAVWADEAILAFRMLGYTGEYLAEHPTLDRFGETAERLMEDLYSKIFPPYGDRHVFVSIGEPVNLSSFMAARADKPRAVVGELTHYAETSIQSALDRINERNPHPGGRLMV